MKTLQVATLGLVASFLVGCASVPGEKAASTTSAGPRSCKLLLHVWPKEARELPGVAEAIRVDDTESQGFSGSNSLARLHGKQLRDAFAAGKLNHSITPRLVRVSFIMTPQASGGPATITAEQPVAEVLVTGLYELEVTEAQVAKWGAVRFVAVKSDVGWPPRSVRTGLREVRFFNQLPGKARGEWRYEFGPACVMNTHMLE